VTRTCYARNLRIALDATYSLGQSLSGVGVYSREILNGLAATDFAEGWDWFYRSQRYLRAHLQKLPRHVRIRRLSGNKGDRTAPLFHGLNQRLPELRFRYQIATFHDLFVLSGDYSTSEFRERFASQARAAAAAADIVVAVSAFTALQVENYLNVPASRIRVIHHGVLPRPVQPAAPREKIVLCVGALQKRKNQTALIRAFRAAPPDWTTPEFTSPATFRTAQSPAGTPEPLFSPFHRSMRASVCQRWRPWPQECLSSRAIARLCPKSAATRPCSSTPQATNN